LRKRNQKPVFESVEDYRQEAEKVLSLDVRNYISGSTGSGATLASNESAFSKFLIRRRVLQGIEKVETSISYFDGKIQSELPFFPSCINLAPMYPKALLDVFRLSKSFKVPICVSDLSIVEPLQMSELPRLVPKTSPLIWQMYFHHDNYDLIMKQTRLASKWGYSAVVVTVDTEQSVKLGYGRQRAIFTHDFRIITDSDIKKIRATTTLPLIAKGIMTSEDAELAVESGADAVVVSNHGGRTMDCGEAAIEALPKIVEHMKSKKATRNAEIFFDSGIRRGTDIIKALALGARGCLIGRPYFWALAVDRRNGIEDVTRILRAELVRTAALCGVRDLSKVDPGTIRTA
jgi:isopentenyl diphosphate isomerase/L-lactate dehydrogenase-like FMN-dependent dehydrogenase